MGKYRVEGGRVFLERPFRAADFSEDAPDPDAIVADCDRCGAWRVVRPLSTVVLFDAPKPIHHNQWGVGCQCGGNFRIPAGIYDHDADGRLIFVRPLDETDPEPGTPGSFTFAWARRGDREAIATALRRLGRRDLLTADEAADAVDNLDPRLAWLSKWLRDRGNELNRNQLGFVVAIVGILIAVYGLVGSRQVVLSDDQMDTLIDRIDAVQSAQLTDDDVERVVKQVLDDDEQLAEEDVKRAVRQVLENDEHDDNGAAQ